jgi:RND family efflux transporter MFP subunit
MADDDSDDGSDDDDIPIFHVSKLVVPEEETRFASVPSGATIDDLGLPIDPPPSGTHVTQKRDDDRYAFATEAVVTTPGGKQCACRTVNLSPKGLLADGPRGKASPLRLGMICRVTLRREKRVIDFEAEIVRIDPPVQRRGPSFAFRITLLTREAQADLLRLIEEAKEPRAAQSNARVLPLAKVVAVLGVAMLVAASGWSFAHRKQATIVATTTPVRGPISELATSRSGEVVAEHRTIVRSTLSVPTVMKLSVRRGDRVKAGAVLAEPADDRLRVALGGARKRLAVAQVNSARASQRSDEDDESAAQQDSSLQRLEKLQRVHDAARLAQDAVVGARAALDARASEVKASQITAPFDGVVVDLKIQPGDLVAPSAPICDFLDDGAVRVNAQFDETDIGRIGEGMPAQVTVTGNKGTVRGTVERIGEIVQADAKVHTVLVELALPDRPQLRPGTTAQGEIVLDTKPNALTLPRSAIAGQDGNWSVFVVDRDSKLEVRALRLGVLNRDLAEVLGGVPEGARVVLDASAPGLASGLLVSTPAK